MRLRIFVTHPVQYHVPLWRALAAHPALDVKVFYFSDHSVRGAVDRDFGVTVEWDVDLLSEYKSEFLSRHANLQVHGSVRIEDVDALLSSEKPDWIWISGYTMGFERQLRMAAHRHGARLIMRAEFSDLSYGRRSVAKWAARAAYLVWFYRGVDAFCFPGELGRRHLLKHGVRPERLAHSPYSVDDSLITRSRSELSRADARVSLGVPDQRFVFLLSGKLIARKDPFAVLEGLRRSNLDLERVGLIVLGDGELRPSFEAAARRLLGERVIAPGFINQTQLGRFFLAADALVMPSRHETWGLVVNEAMHYGLPAIVSDQVGCHADLVVAGKTGFVYPCGDSRALGRCMDAIARDPRIANEMGIAAEAHIQQYTVQRSALGVSNALGLAT